MKKTFLLIALITLFISCSPLDQKCGTDLETIVLDLKILIESGDITDEEFSILSDKIFKHENLSQIAGKKTYREILKNAKISTLLKEKRDVREKIELEKKIGKMNEFLNVSLSKNINIHYKNSAGIYPLNIINKSKNNIRGFKGVLIIKDLLGTEIETLDIEFDDLIKNSTEINAKYHDFKYYYDFNEILINKNISKFKTEWIPKKIIFQKDVSLKKGNIDILDVTISNKHLEPWDNQRGWTWTIEFKNNSQRVISAFKVNIIIKDLFDKEIASFSTSIDTQIKPSSILKVMFPTGNYYDDKGNNEREHKNIKNLKIEWNIEKIIFLDEIQ